MPELAEILASANITKALIVDDAIDEVPRADDLSADGDLWTHFFDDLSGPDKAALTAAFPDFAVLDAEDLQKADTFVACLWANKGAIAPALCSTLFARYVADMQADTDHLNVLRLSLRGSACHATPWGETL